MRSIHLVHRRCAFAAAVALFCVSTSASAATLMLTCLPLEEGGAGEAFVSLDAQPFVGDGQFGCPDLVAAATGDRDGVELFAKASVAALNGGILHSMTVDAGTHPLSLIAHAAVASDSTFVVPLGSSGDVRLELTYFSSGIWEAGGLVDVHGLGFVDTSNLQQGLNTFDFSLTPAAEYGLTVFGGIGTGSALGSGTQEFFIRMVSLPEPTTAVLLLGGTLGLALRGRGSRAI